MKQFKSITPIGWGNAKAIPVKVIDPAVDFYTRVLGFTLVTKDRMTAVLTREDVEIGLIAKDDHDPKSAGSFYIGVNDLDTLRSEFQGKGAKPGAIEYQHHEGKKYRLFFLRECDMMDVHDGYCFCFGQPA